MARGAQVKSEQLNLNLLRVLHELLKQRSVTKTAQALFMSQPTVSVSLKKLRDHYQDQLIVRDNNEYVLTEFAEGLVPVVIDALARVEKVVEYHQGFDAQTSDRTFTVAMSTYVHAILFGSLYTRILKVAPNINLKIIHSRRRVGELFTGDADITVIGYPLSHGRNHQYFLEDRWCGIRERTDERELVRCSMEEWHAIEWVRSPLHCMHDYRVTLSNDQKEMFRARANKNLGLVQTLYTGNSLSSAYSVIGTTLAAYVPRRLAERMVGLGPFSLSEPPIPTPSFTENISWSRSASGDPGIMWLKEQCFETLRAIDLKRTKKAK